MPPREPLTDAARARTAGFDRRADEFSRLVEETRRIRRDCDAERAFLAAQRTANRAILDQLAARTRAAITSSREVLRAHPAE